MKIRNRSKSKSSMWFVWELEDQAEREIEFIRHLCPEENAESALDQEKEEWSHCGGCVFLLKPGECVTLARCQTDEELREKRIQSGAMDIIADGGDPSSAYDRSQKHEAWKEGK